MRKSFLSLVPGVLLVMSAMTQAAELTVSAASSLGGAFRDIARSYETLYPDTPVLLNVGGSGALLQQMARGAPVDVLATADQDTLDQAQRQGLIDPGSRRDFAGNELVMIVPAAAPPLSRLEEVAGPDVRRIALGNPASVPVGRYAMRALEAAGLWPALRERMIHTQNVRQSLDYVARGEVDAGFVYATDARAMAERVRVAFVVTLETPIRYPVARLLGSPRAEAAQRFIDHLLSPAGQAILARHGFLAP